MITVSSLEYGTAIARLYLVTDKVMLALVAPRSSPRSRSRSLALSLSRSGGSMAKVELRLLYYMKFVC